MTNKIVRTFYCDKMNSVEKCSYLDYLNGDKSQDIWIDTVRNRIDILNKIYSTCQVIDGFTQCGGVIEYSLLGNCVCGIGHSTHNVLEYKIKESNVCKIFEKLSLNQSITY
jgi:hypothetical protein